MESIYLIIPVALILTFIGIAIYLWAVNSGQYDDLERHASQTLFEDHLDRSDTDKTDQTDNSKADND